MGSSTRRGAGLTGEQPARSISASRVRKIACWIFDLPRTWLRRARDRAELRKLGYRDLRDIGFPNDSAIRKEAYRPFWRRSRPEWEAIVTRRDDETEPHGQAGIAADRRTRCHD